ILLVVKVLLLTFCVVIVSKVHEQLSFEAFLASSSITFNDFETDYATALRGARFQPQNVPEYNYTSIPSPPPTAQLTIPPIIHFIWFQNEYTSHLDISTIPATISHAPARCHEHNPSFQILIWNATAASTFMAEHYAWFLPIYTSYPHPIQRIDALKYFLLWHYGGVYMDLDVSCRRPLNPLLAFPAWYPKASPVGVNNDLMASRARHPLVGMMLEQLSVKNKSWGLTYLTVFWSTGPQFVSGVMKRWW
ncbi:glycosyltransferase family 32 protein, partial [Myriangium duriaei CBS 260.36]